MKNCNNKEFVFYVIIVSFAVILWIPLFIFGENKLSHLIGLIMTLSAMIIGVVLKKKYNFYEKMDEKSQKFFKWFVIIGSTITVVCLLLLALYVHNKTS